MILRRGGAEGPGYVFGAAPDDVVAAVVTMAGGAPVRAQIAGNLYTVDLPQGAQLAAIALERADGRRTRVVGH